MLTPVIHIGKNERSFEITGYVPDHYPHLEAMYQAFTPKARFQGMPPRDREVAGRWLQGLIRDGENFMAWQDERVIGHVVILPDFHKKDAEYLIFVSRKARGSGVGKALTLTALQKARDLGMDVVWLTVDAYNFRATKLYRKVGFEFCEGYSASSERMMILKL